MDNTYSFNTTMISQLPFLSDMRLAAYLNRNEICEALTLLRNKKLERSTSNYIFIALQRTKLKKILFAGSAFTSNTKLYYDPSIKPTIA